MARSAISLAVLALFACTRSDAPADALADGADARLDVERVDAPPPDASEASADVSADAPEDDVPDVPSDAGPTDPEWATFAEGPPGCVAERATYPERVLSVEWLPCMGTVACVRSRLSATDMIPRAVSRLSDGRWWFGLNSLAIPVVSVAMAEDGAIAAWRSPGLAGDNLCALGGLALRGDAVAFLFQHSVASQLTAVFYAGTAATLPSLDAPVRTLGPDELQRLGVQRVLFDGSTIGGDLDGAAGYALDVATGTFRVLRPLTPVLGVSDVNLVDGRVYWWARYDLILEGSAFDGPNSFIDGPPGFEMGAFAADAAHVVWLQGYDRDTSLGGWARLELWAAPYTTDAAALAPRLVRALPAGWGTARLVLGDGIVGQRHVEADSTTTVEMFDLADGRRRRFRVPDDVVFDDVLHVSAQRVWLRVRAAGADELLSFDPRDIPYEP